MVAAPGAGERGHLLCIPKSAATVINDVCGVLMEAPQCPDEWGLSALLWGSCGLRLGPTAAAEPVRGASAHARRMAGELLLSYQVCAWVVLCRARKRNARLVTTPSNWQLQIDGWHHSDLQRLWEHARSDTKVCEGDLRRWQLCGLYARFNRISVSADTPMAFDLQQHPVDCCSNDSCGIGAHAGCAGGKRARRCRSFGQTVL